MICASLSLILVGLWGLGHELKEGLEGPEEGEDKKKERREEESKERAAEAAGWERIMLCLLVLLLLVDMYGKGDCNYKDMLYHKQFDDGSCSPGIDKAESSEDEPDESVVEEEGEEKKGIHF